VDHSLLTEEAERNLHDAVRSIQDRVAALVKAGDVLGALLTIAEIRPLVDQFFDAVLVMHQDEKIKTNRLNLVSEVTGLFAAIADFRRV
jgi:glycyl-tRNA synthetase beta chain